MLHSKEASLLADVSTTRRSILTTTTYPVTKSANERLFMHYVVLSVQTFCMAERLGRKYVVAGKVQLFFSTVTQPNCKTIRIKALLQDAIFPSTCNATDDENIARQVAGYMLSALTYLAMLRKVET